MKMKINKQNKEVFSAEIEELTIKSLKLFESADADYNSLGFSVTYTRVPGGIIRTTMNTETMSQVFIPLENEYFIN